ncbi:hypothetical protein GQ44DRAFT_687256 [Phaeosphaeriaceae sp. PMI808]|nr:hypothetical protein GQ44DRAFT_687256 [Phaeosphaeriaceae sp. PMI808]
MDWLRHLSISALLLWNTSQKTPQELLSLPVFAQEVCLKLLKLLQEIKALRKAPGTAAAHALLPTTLADFQTRLSKVEQTLNNKDIERILRTLDKLEQLCQWPEAYYPIATAHIGFNPDYYPSLNKLLSNEDRACARESLTQFFEDYKKKQATAFWTSLITSLKNVESELKGPNHAELIGRASSYEIPPDKEPFILSLCNSLVHHCQCRCKQACEYLTTTTSTCEYLTANIRLNWNGNTQCRHDRVSNFNLFFLDQHDVPGEKSGCFWRDMRISISAASTPRRVGFKVNSESEQKKYNQNNPEDHQISLGSDEIESCNHDDYNETVELCHYIKQARKNQFQVQLIETGGSLRLIKECFLRKEFLTHVPSTSLGALIDHVELTDRNKAVLSYLLVDSVWQYYNSGWEEWSNESIQFMSQRVGVSNESEVVYINQPFLRSTFDQSVPELTTRRGGLKKPQPAPRNSHTPQERRSHDYPRILALGIMLLEIQLGRKLTSLKTADYFDENPKVVQHLLALDLFEDKTLWPPKHGWLAIKEMIEICIDREKSEKTFGKDVFMVRQKLFEQIVAPFRVFVLEAWKPKDIDEVDPVTLDSVKRARKKTAEQNPNVSDAEFTKRGLVINTYLVMNRFPLIGIRSSNARKWFDNLEELTAELSLRKRKDKNACPPTKVAILDTGVTKECYDKYIDSIHGYKDFVSKLDDSPQDGTGHGTTALRLLLKLYEDAEVYVGRVFKQQDADDETERLMAEASLRSTNRWNVDVICIPSGFNQDDRSPPYRDDLYEAIIAKPSNKNGQLCPRSLIFAAASNLGFTSNITYPGCLSKSSKVLCFFSTSADGNPNKPGFNPAAVPLTYNLALLGEGIEIDPNSDPVRGTSFSTIIAGAIAAHILDFSNHEDVRGQITHVKYLREVEGMTSVFASMGSAEVNGYQVLEPWTLKAHNRPEELDRKELRQEICRKLSDALASRDSRKYGLRGGH